MLHETFGGLNTKTAHFLSLKAVVLRNHYFLLLCSNRLCRNSRVLLHESEFTCSPLGWKCFAFSAHMFAEIISLKVLQNHVVLPPFCSRDCHMTA